MYKIAIATAGGVGETIYQDAVYYGKIKGWLILIVGSIISFSLFILGFRQKNTKDIYDRTTNAKVNSANCSTNSYRSKYGTSSQTDCDLKTEYVVDSVVYNHDFTARNKGTFQPGQNIPLRYSSTNPSNVTDNMTPNSVSGTVSMVIGAVLFFGSFLYWLTTNKLRFVAASVAVDDAFDMIRR